MASDGGGDEGRTAFLEEIDAELGFLSEQVNTGSIPIKRRDNINLLISWGERYYASAGQTQIETISCRTSG